ncbi:hypothetical protein P7C71_g1135, partial [Lecanoromycetidae sp. Uapishka_2]
MHFTYPTLALAALTFSTVAQPTKHLHQHLHKRDLAELLHKRVDWSDQALYKGVDWSTVNYGAGAAAAHPATPAPTPTPSPAAAAAAPVQANEKVAVADPSPAATNNNADTGTGKRGLAYNPTSPNLDIFEGYSKITWGYNWDSNPAGLPSKFQYVPTLFSTLEVHLQNWDQNVKNAISGSGTHYVMSFNEPDIVAPQAQMSVGEAVAAYKQYMAPYGSSSVKLGSPSVSNGVGTNPATGQPMGLDWLTPFLQQCDGCQIDFVPIHWYGCNNGCPVEDDVASFKQQVGSAITVANGRPVWVTEFQSLANGEAFLTEVLPWLDGQNGVERYSYFMVESGVLTTGNAVSALGQQYASS